MKRTTLFLAFLTVIVGCVPQPRYRTVGEGTPARTAPGKVRSGYSTNQLLRLGRIMRSYLGKPYLGTSKYETGVDCSSFVQAVFMKFDKIPLPRTVAEQFQLGKLVTHRQLVYGDLVFFKTVGGRVSHVGIYTGHNEFIHASSSRGVIISSLSEKYWSKRFAAGRHGRPRYFLQTRPELKR